MISYGTPDPITVVDLFAGCGGFTRGFHEFRPQGVKGSGPVFRSIAAVEHDRSAAATYAANFGSLREEPTGPHARVHVGDIEEWGPTDEDLHADVVVGGPPCQGFSALNRKKTGLERNRLWEEYVRIVARIRPKVFVIENVDRFLKSDEFQDLLGAVKPGGSLENYHIVDPWGPVTDGGAERPVSRYLLNAADYGAVQARRRAIIMGVREDLLKEGAALSYPPRSYTSNARSVGRRSEMSGQETLFRDGLSTDSWLPVDSVFEESAKLRLRGTELPAGSVPFPEIGNDVRGVFTTRDLHIRRNPELLSRARYRAIPRRGNRNDLRGKWFTMTESGRIRILEEHELADVSTPVEYLSTESWDNHDKGTGDVMGRLRLGEPSVTIRTEFYKPEKGRYLHPTRNRPITHYEAARIQGFPEDFRWCGTKVEIARQIGNAVPIPLGRAIASAIYACLRGGGTAVPPRAVARASA
ncbi:DNA cytosine methyltransferase [Streptomyces sp. NPDC057072]|uniref:DNA cytosine methyltransferase n=1 Tax=Streptomyces sp. NPDC057072 TaxID=3346014 RepID=UPI003624C5AE